MKKGVTNAILIKNPPGEISQGGTNRGRGQEPGCAVNEGIGVINRILQLSLLRGVLGIAREVLGGGIKVVVHPLRGLGKISGDMVSELTLLLGAFRQRLTKVTHLVLGVPDIIGQLPGLVRHGGRRAWIAASLKALLDLVQEVIQVRAKTLRLTTAEKVRVVVGADVVLGLLKL